MLDIVFLFTQVLNKESYSSTSTLNLEKSCGDGPSPSPGNRLHSLVILCVLV